MGLLLGEVARGRCRRPPGTHAVVLLDGAGWHVAAELEVPPALTLVPLPLPPPLPPPRSTASASSPSARTAGRGSA